jgi:hypothetical protein
MPVFRCQAGDDRGRSPDDDQGGYANSGEEAIYAGAKTDADQR